MRRWPLFVLIFFGCRRSPATRHAEEGLRDELGISVLLSSPPKRIVSLLPSHTETLFALGVGDRVVLRDERSDFPPEVRKIPEAGNMLSLRVERIVAERPDLVLTSEYGTQAAALRNLGLTTFAASAQRYDEVFSTVRLLGRLVGEPERGDSLANKMQTDVALLEAKTRALPRPRVYFEIDLAPYTVSPRSFVGILLEKAGAANITPESEVDYPEISVERIALSDPEVVLGIAEEEAQRRPGWSEMSAVKHKRVIPLTHDERNLVTRPGPRLAEALALLIARIHPELSP